MSSQDFSYNSCYRIVVRAYTIWQLIISAQWQRQFHCWSLQTGGHLCQSCTASKNIRMSHALIPRGCLWKSGINHIIKGCSAFLEDSGLRAYPADCGETVVCVTKYVGELQTPWEAGCQSYPSSKVIYLKLMWQERRHFPTNCQLS